MVAARPDTLGFSVNSALYRETSMSISFLGQSNAYCDGLARREFLRIGGLGFGGLSLSELLRSEARAGQTRTGKSVINIYLGGGPTHMDTFDLKPNAPQEYRGEFSPIATKSPGLDICELMPELATVGDRFSVVRSVDDMRNEHNAKQSESGWSVRSLDTMGGRPGVGSVMSRVLGPAVQTDQGTAPTNVDLTGWTRPGFLGQVHAAYRPDTTGRGNLMLHKSISVERLDDRRGLLSGLDRLRRDLDRSGMMSAMDSFSDRAVGMITSGEIYQALDLKNEDPKTLDRYGVKQRRDVDRFVTARRLIESGVRCVSFSWGGWDTHSSNFATMRKQLPPLSRALAALITDLDAAGRLDDTIIMMSGEFGRTPRVNGKSGRDHWPKASFVFLAGGGFQHGQAIGSTNRLGEVPKDRPVHLQQVFSTIYQQLGIDPDNTVLNDPNGRPQYLVDHREVISELI